MKTLLVCGMALSLCCTNVLANDAKSASGLAAALEATLVYNPAIKGKQAELNAKEYAVASARARRYPSVSASANNLNEDYDQGSIRVQQPLWAFGKIDSAIDQAKADASAEQLALLQVQRELIEQTAAAYARIDGVKKRIAVSNDNIAEHQRLHQRIQRRSAGELASEADVHLAYSRLVQAQSQKARLHGELQVALTDLQALTQVAISSDGPVATAFTQLPELAEVEQQAQARHADILYKRKRLKVVRFELKQEKVAPLPTVYFQVEHEFLETRDNRDDTRAGLALESSLDGLGLVARGRAKGAEARLKAAQQDIDVTINEVTRRVNTLMLNRKTQQGLLRSQRNVVSAVEATMASFLRQYDIGRKSWLEVLNTQRELTEMRLLQEQINNEYLVISLRVSALIGGLDEISGLNNSSGIGT